jgi:hypothetical protein
MHPCFFLEALMKKLHYSALMLLVAALLSGTAHADFKFSTSGTDSEAGTDLKLATGETGSMYVWMSTEVDQRLIAVSFNVFADDLLVAQALSHSIENPNEGGLNRWSAINEGSVNANGNLVDGARAFYIPGLAEGNGIETAGPSDFVLFSSFEVTAIGGIGSQTNLTFTEVPSAGVSELGGSGNIWNDIPKGSASISVVPEPGSFAAVLGLTGMILLRRSRRPIC